MNSIVRMPRNVVSRGATAPQFPVQQVMPPQQGMPTQQGNWFWDGSRWCCGDSDDIPPFPCPPPGFPPPGCPPWFSGVNSPPWYPGANAGVSFGTTAPLNPVRGHFWWNGLGLALFDGAAWVDAVTGVVLPPAGSPGHPPGSPGVPGSGGGVIIQPTPPASPAAGTEWWNGTVLQLWDGTTWKVIGPGAASGPVATTAIQFALNQPTSVPVGVNSSSWTAVPFTATPQVDVQNAYNPTNHRYTPTKAGVYEFGARGLVSGTTGGLALVKNDPGTFTSLSSDILIAIASVNSAGWLNCNGFVQMNGTTDYVRYWAYDTSGVFPSTGPNPVFTAVLFP